MKRYINTQQKGSAHVVAIICLVLALITALGWIFYQNFIAKEPVRTETDLVVVDKKDTAKQPEADPSEGGKYLVLKDWEVRLEIPSSLKNTEVIAWKAGSNSYYFNTERVRDLEPSCNDKNSNFEGGRYNLGILVRNKTSSEGGPDVIMLNDNKPIDSFFYSTSGAKATCYTGMQSENLEKDRINNQDSLAVGKMLQTVQAY